MTETERVTLRLPKDDLAMIDLFVEAGEFSNRSEAIRQSIKDFVRNKTKQVKEGMEARKEFQEQFLQMQEMKRQLEQQQEILKNLMRK